MDKRANMNMRRSRLATSMAIVVIAVAGCTGSTATPSAISTKTAAPVGQAASPTTAANTLTVAYEDNCQIELIAPSGQRVLIDVYDPTLLTSPAKSTDILLTTHLHSDHYNAAFESSFPGKKITNATADTTMDGVKIKSIAASHDDSAIVPDAPTNHIFVIEFDGFKIVHGGSTGQLSLTPDQVAAIGGNVDIAAIVLQNVGGTDPGNTKPIDIAKQINPKLIIPTHSALAYVQAAGKLWKSTYSGNLTVKIRHDQLPSQTTMLFMGSLATSYGAILSSPETEW